MIIIKIYKIKVRIRVTSIKSPQISFATTGRILQQIKGKYLLGDFVKKWFEKKVDNITTLTSENKETKYVSKVLQENVDYFKAQLGSAFDVKYRSIKISNIDFAFVMVDGLCDNMLITEQILQPIQNADFKDIKTDKVVFVASDTVSASIDKSNTNDLDKAIRELVSGNLVMLVEGCEFSVLFGVQMFAKRLPQEPNVENQERGSREGFVENFKDNVAMVRRRIRNPVFKADLMEIGTTSKTRVCVCYMSDRISEETLNDVVKRLKTAKLDTILGSGYLQPFLDHKRWSIFTCVGMTQRPDVFSAKLSEGKIGVIIDGSPDALFVPYLFVEHFQSLDDYLKRPYYATFVRILKMISFICSAFLAGLYVAICTFHQEMIPESMVFGITSQESKTPLPIVAEALLIHLIYEIVREAGLRMPKPVGHAVSIVGALVIGESAVSAGIIAAPMLIVVGLTAVSSFVVSSLYEPVAVMRFLFIVIGGVAGIYGIMLGFAVVLVNICALSPYNTPFTTPISPTRLGAIRDLIVRTTWLKMGKKFMTVGKLEQKNDEE